MIKNKHGFTLIESVASIVIVTLILVTAFSIIVAMRNHTFRTEAQLEATEIANDIRYDLEHNYDYITVSNWLNQTEVIVTDTTCSTSILVCTLFDQVVDGTDYGPNITITFLAPTTSSMLYEIIHFQIEILYYNDLTLKIEGAIYA